MKKFNNRAYFCHWTDGPKVFIDTLGEYDLNDVPQIPSVHAIACDVAALENVIETYPSECPTFYINCDPAVMRIVMYRFNCNFIWVTDYDPTAAYH